MSCFRKYIHMNNLLILNGLVAALTIHVSMTILMSRKIKVRGSQFIIITSTFVNQLC